jgi:serine/threonine protein phosphatase PrpC
MKVVGISDIGLVREKNEDAFLIDEDQGFFFGMRWYGRSSGRTSGFPYGCTNY